MNRRQRKKQTWDPTPWREVRILRAYGHKSIRQITAHQRRQARRADPVMEFIRVMDGLQHCALYVEGLRQREVL